MRADFRARAHALLDEMLDAIGVAGDLKAPRVFNQDDRPEWARTPNVYLRAWRVLHGESHPGVTARGKTRLMTQSASDAWLARRAPAKRREALKLAPKPRNLDDEI